jgi:hypothetical protein
MMICSFKGEECSMVDSLNQTQEGRVYNSFYRTCCEIIETKMDDATRRNQINNLRDNLQQRVNEQYLQGLHLQDAMIDYLLIREHEEALHLPRTTVPVILLPHFQNIMHPELRAVVNRLAAFPTSTVQVNAPQLAHTSAPATPYVSIPQDAKYAILVESYNAVRDGRITDPKTIREVARRFLEIENNPETYRNFPYYAGEAALILLRRAKLYEDRYRMQKDRGNSGSLTTNG